MWKRENLLGRLQREVLNPTGGAGRVKADSGELEQAGREREHTGEAHEGDHDGRDTQVRRQSGNAGMKLEKTNRQHRL